MIKKFRLLISTCALPALLLCFSSSTLAETSMSKLVENFETNACSAILVKAAEATIKENPHRLLTPHKPPNSRALPSLISGVIQYKDRQSHITYSTDKQNDRCHVASIETFTFKSPCLTVREEVFSKWSIEGKLNNTTMVLKSRRKAHHTAHLTDARDGSYCLVSRHTAFGL